MGDVKTDVDAMMRVRAGGSTRLRIASELDDFMVRIFKERIRRRHPHANARQALKILRKELSYGRRDNI